MERKSLLQVTCIKKSLLWNARISYEFAATWNATSILPDVIKTSISSASKSEEPVKNTLGSEIPE